MLICRFPQGMRQVILRNDHSGSYLRLLNTSSVTEYSYFPTLRKLLATPKIQENVDTEYLLKRKRWMLIPFATANHICLGSVYAWSLFNQPLTRISGVVAPAAGDWVLGDVTTTFSLIMGGFGWGVIFSKYLDALGPRLCGLIGSFSLGGGFTLASIAAETHSLPLLWLGGAVWGISNGITVCIYEINQDSELTHCFHSVHSSR